MSRGLLGATMYIETLQPIPVWTREQQKNVENYVENWRNFKFEKKGAEPSAKKPKLAEQLEEEIETSCRLWVEFAGFQEIDEKALEKLKNVVQNRLLTMARQFSAADRRKKDGLEMRFKSPLEWTLKLAGIQKVIEIKEWYDVTYWQRYRRLEGQLRNDGRLSIRE